MVRCKCLFLRIIQLHSNNKGDSPDLKAAEMPIPPLKAGLYMLLKGTL